jgi:hypothetical protein
VSALRDAVTSCAPEPAPTASAEQLIQAHGVRFANAGYGLQRTALAHHSRLLRQALHRLSTS